MSASFEMRVKRSSASSALEFARFARDEPIVVPNDPITEPMATYCHVLDVALRDEEAPLGSRDRHLACQFGALCGE